MASLDQLLIFAARSGNVGLVAERLAGGANPNHVDDRHSSALLEAIRCGHVPVVQTLLANGADPNTVIWRGDGPLEYALHFRHDEIVALLLEAQAKLRPHARDTYQQLLAATLQRQREV